MKRARPPKRLTARAAIFAVAKTALVRIWGNFKVMPELKLKWDYPAALGLILSAGTVAVPALRLAVAPS